MRRFLIALGWCFLFAAASAASALAQGNGFVGIYTDAGATTPCTTVPAGTGAILYVVATLEGATADGITGAEFRIEVSNPAGWFLSYASATGATALGNVLDTDPADPGDGSGTTMAFSTSSPPASRVRM